MNAAKSKIVPKTRPMLACLVMACLASGPAEARKQQGPTEEELAEQLLLIQQQMDALTDQMFQHAHDAGLAIVVTTTLNLDHKYRGQDETIAHSALYTTSKSGSFVTDRTSTADWIATSGGASFKVGNDHDSENGDLTRSLYQFVAGGTRYVAYVLPAGTYRLAGVSFNQPRSLAPTAAPRGTVVASSLGSIAFTERTFTEGEVSMEWRGARYYTRSTDREVCTSVYVQTGYCASVSTVTDEVTTESTPGGFYRRVKGVGVDGLSVAATFSKDFASFSVAAGEVVLIDGLFAEDPIASFDANACERVLTDVVECAPSAFHLTRIPAYPADMGRAKALARGYPKFAQLLEGIQYRELDIAAKPDAKVADERERYSLRAER